MRSGTGRARMPSGRGSTSCSRASSPGRRSSPTTPASRARAPPASGGPASATSCPTIPLFGLGAVIAMSRAIGDAPGLLTAIAAGGAASVLALLALTVDESDEAFANVYSGAVSLQNLLPEVPQRLLVAGTAARGDDRGAAHRPAQLPAVPVPARVVLRAALRGAARRLAARRTPLRLARTCSPAPAVRVAAARGLARRVLPLPVAVPRRPRAGGRGSWRTRDPHSLPWGGASLPSFALAFALTSAAGLLARQARRSARA